MKLSNRSLILLLVVLVVAGHVAHRHGSNKREADRSTPASPDEQAIGRLRQDGMYESLQEAITAARYKVYADEKAGRAFYANNAQQNLSATFTPSGLQIAIAERRAASPLVARGDGGLPNEESGPRLQLAMRFMAAGYGDTTYSIASNPELMAEGNHISYKYRPATANQSAIEEWYANKPEGIEHGFTLSEPVGERVAGERLRLELEVGGGFLAQAVEEGKRIVFKSKDGSAQLSYAGLKASDARGRELAARMMVNGTVLRFEVEDATAVYPVTIDPTFTQEQKLVPGVSATDSFGSDVAISGDTAVAGASGDDIGANADQGSIYVFVRSGTTWSQQAKLTASDGASGDRFGSSVAISLNTIVVGAPSDDNGSFTDLGSAYVFVRSGTTWSQQQKLTGFNQTNELFGYDVTIDGDYAAMSAKGAMSAGLTGLVFVFHRVGMTWTNVLTTPGDFSERTTNDDFGQSIALSGDTLVIGAPSKTITIQPPDPCSPPSFCNDQCGVNCVPFVDCYCCPKTPAVGTVHIIVRSGTTWVAQQTIVGTGTLDSCRKIVNADHLGGAVAISGDTVVIGSPAAYRAYQPNAGLVSIWVRSGTIWTSQYSLPGSDNDQNVGRAVAIDGDTAVYAWNGPDKMLVRSGTTWSLQQSLTSISNEVAISGNTALAASWSYTKVFVRSGTTWTEQAELTAQEGAAGDQFGYSVAVDGHTAVVGVPSKNAGSHNDQGAVLVFEKDTSANQWVQKAELNASDGAASDHFGNDVAIDGNTIVVGAQYHNSFRGAVYIFTGSNLVWTQRAIITAADGQGDLFGYSVALSRNTLVVGSPLNDAGGHANQGSAYVFTGSGATWALQTKLRAIEEADGDQFGSDVAIDGDTIAIGARYVDNGTSTLQGAAYVFTRAGTSWSQQARLLARDGASDDNFGQAVALSGDTLAVGSPFRNVGPNANQGAVYLFNRTGSAWTQAQVLTASDGAGDDTFGISLALQNDALLVGAGGDDFAQTMAQGSAYLFIRSGSTWSEAKKLFAIDGANNDGLGNAVALDDRTFLIGASNDDFGSAVDQGSAYVFVASGGATWMGTNSSDWSTASNWSSTAVPNALDDVTIPGSGVMNEAVIDADMSVHGLTVEAGRSLTITAGRTLTVNSNLTLNGTITGGGTLVFNGATFTNNNSVVGVDVQFGSGAKFLASNGSFFNNTVTVLSGSTVGLYDSTMNRLVINSGGTMNPGATGTLTLIGGGTVLVNNGSFVAAASSTVSFSGTNAQSTAGNITFQNLTVNNAAGVTLGADATVNGTLALTGGDLNTGAFTLTMPAAAISTGTTDVIGNVKRLGFTTANTLSFGNPFNTIRFTSGTPPTDVTVSLVKQTPPDFINAVRRTSTITPNGGSGYAATVRLHYLDAELNGNAEATLGLWRKGASWTNLGATTRNATDNWVELVGIAQFSPWVISGPAAPCGCGVSPANRFFTVAGGPGSLNVTTSSGCNWTATASDDWITLTSSGGGTGNDVVTYEVRENFTSSPRQGVISISGNDHIIIQDAGLGEDCSYFINPTAATFSATGGGGSISVTAEGRCAWQAVANVNWITINSGGIGVGNGVVSYTVATNPIPGGRSGRITIGDQVFRVKQK